MPKRLYMTSFDLSLDSSRGGIFRLGDVFLKHLLTSYVVRDEIKPLLRRGGGGLYSTPIRMQKPPSLRDTFIIGSQSYLKICL